MKIKTNLKSITPQVISYITFIVFTFLTVYPLFWLGYSSFKTNLEIQKNAFSFAEVLQFTNYTDAWKYGQLGISFFNSIIYTISTVSLVLMCAMMASFAFAKMSYKKVSKIIYGFIGMGILISTHSILIPLFLMLLKLGLTNTRLGIILTYTAVNLPLGIFLGTEFIKGIPDSLLESAFIDGASNMKVFTSIILPMTSPVLVTAGIITGLAAWNEFLLGFIISGPLTRGLPPAIVAFANPRAPNFHLQFAALVIGTLPIILVYIFLNKKITKGVVAGSVKG